MKKIHQTLFSLLIFLLPVQLGKHFWPAFSFIGGLRIDYYSPTLYLTDLLIILILALFALEKLKLKKFKPRKIPPLVLLFFLYLFLNCVLAPSPKLAFYKFLKISEFFLLGVYIAQTKTKIRKLILFPLALSCLYVFIIALLQFADKSSLGGVFYWLGERTFNLSTPGIARIVFRGQEILRPYATFPHPNALAGFILVSLLLFFALNLPLFLEKPILVSSLITIFLTFSRSAWITTLVFLPLALFLTLSKRKKSVAIFLKPLLVSLGLIILIFSLFRASSPTSDSKNIAFASQSLPLRIELNKAALEMIKKHPLAGVGLNNFILTLPRYSPRVSQTLWLQPVHNLYLLIAAETGLIGLLFFLLFFFLSLKKTLTPKTLFSSLPLFCVFFLGLFDHYFFTLQQTQLLFTLTLALPWSKN